MIIAGRSGSSRRARNTPIEAESAQWASSKTTTGLRSPETSRSAINLGSSVERSSSGSSTRSPSGATPNNAVSVGANEANSGLSRARAASTIVAGSVPMSPAGPSSTLRTAGDQARNGVVRSMASVWAAMSRRSRTPASSTTSSIRVLLPSPESPTTSAVPVDDGSSKRTRRSSSRARPRIITGRRRRGSTVPLGSNTGIGSALPLTMIGFITVNEYLVWARTAVS